MSVHFEVRAKSYGRTVALGLLPLAFDVRLPKGGDCGEDLLLCLGLVPEVVVVWISL